MDFVQQEIFKNLDIRSSTYITRVVYDDDDDDDDSGSS
jgi:hypothetical protein